MRQPRLNLRPAAGLAALFWAHPARAAEHGLEIIPDPSMLLWLVIGFLVLIPLVSRLLLQPLLRVLDERESRIGGARERAGQVSGEADAIVSRYEAEVHEVRADAERARQSALRAARQEEAASVRAARGEAEQEIDVARGAIETALESARASLRTTAEDLAREAAQRVLGRPLP